MSISAIIIAKNEENMIEDCLKSVAWADEIIVVDSGSEDGTLKIAKKYTNKVIEISSDDFSQLRDKGRKEASGDWLLYVDADERVPAPLKDEILKITQNDEAGGVYAICRNNIYLGKRLKHGGWGDDKVIRLFRKSHLIKWQGRLHEQPEFSGELKYTREPLIHYSHRGLYSMVNKTAFFTGHEAELRWEAHHPPIQVWRIVRVMVTEFWHRFIQLGAVWDGPEGIIDGGFQVFNTFIIYARLWEKQHTTASATPIKKRVG